MGSALEGEAKKLPKRRLLRCLFIGPFFIRMMIDLVEIEKINLWKLSDTDNILFSNFIRSC